MRSIITNLIPTFRVFMCMTLFMLCSCLGTAKKKSTGGFSIGDPPKSFSIFAPNALVNTSNNIAQWGESDGATQYFVFVDDDSDSCSTPLRSFTTTMTSQALGALVDGNYYLCVFALDGESQYSAAENTGYLFSIDTSQPTVINVTSSTSDGGYGLGAVVSITMTLSESLQVTGTPQLKLRTAGVTDQIVNLNASSGADLMFSYTIQPGDSSLDLDYFDASALTLNSGSIKDLAGNNANLTLPVPGAAGSLSANKNIVIDAVTPAVTNVTSSAVNGSYAAGATLPIEVTFSENVMVSGTPQLTLATAGGANQTVDMSSVAGAVLTFNYTVQSGDVSADLEYLSTASLTLNGGIIRDALSNNANLTLPNLGGPGSLSANKNIQIDTVVPAEPLLTATNPVSPFSELRPYFIGTVDSGDASITTVNVFNNSACNAPSLVATGSPANFQTVGLQATSNVPSNAASTYYVQAVDAAGNISACGNNSISYRHSEVQLLSDITNSPASTSSALGCRVVVNGMLYFGAADGSRNGLWKSDGTVGGTVFVRETQTTPVNCTKVGNLVFFRAQWYGAGLENWISDGTTAGTFLLKDIYPGATTSGTLAFSDLNGVAIFNANDPINGSELWRSDGTTAGTYMVSNINPGALGSSPANFAKINTIAGPRVYFRASNGTAGNELWVTDGATATMVLDINPGVASSTPTGLINVNDYLFFNALDANGAELWMTTPAGVTALFANIRAGGAGSNPSNFVSMNNKLYFTADDGVNGIELWTADPAIPGSAQMMRNIHPTGSSSPFALTVANGRLYFAANNGADGIELWTSNGIPFGQPGSDIQMVTNIDGAATNSLGSSAVLVNLTAVGSWVFFKATVAASGTELYAHDGNIANEVFLVKDIVPGANSALSLAADNTFIAFNDGANDTLFFKADDGVNGSEMWISDGTSSGTYLFKDLFPGNGASSPIGLYSSGSNVYFQATNANGTELWKTDGTQAGTVLVKDINPTPGASSFPSFFTTFGANILFQANDGVNGTELWVSDGTNAGTVMVANINPGALSSSPMNFTPMGASIYFNATDAAGSELWKTDGIPGGTTVRLADIWPGANGSNPNYLTVVGSTLYFAATNATNGTELYATDGTNPPVLTDIIAGAAGSNPAHFFNVNGVLIFTADDGVNGRELWKSDGGGTSMLLDMNPTGSSIPNSVSFMVVGTTLYFQATDGTALRLWKTDGTAPGTVKVDTAGLATAPMLMASVNGKILFYAEDADGNELWVTNGTPGNLSKIKDIKSGPMSSNAFPFFSSAVLGNFVYFNAADGTDGMQLWRSNGIAEGQPGAIIEKVGVQTPGISLTVQTPFAVLGSQLIFSGSSPSTDRELFKF